MVSRVKQIIVSRHWQQAISRRTSQCSIHTETVVADDPKKTGLDRKLIAMNEPHEVRRWTESLGVAKQQLAEAVKAVGHSGEVVRAYLAAPIRPRALAALFIPGNR